MIRENEANITQTTSLQTQSTSTTIRLQNNQQSLDNNDHDHHVQQYGTIYLRQCDVTLKSFPRLNISLKYASQENKYMLHCRTAEKTTSHLLDLVKVQQSKNTIICTKLLIETTKLLCCVHRQLEKTLCSLSTYINTYSVNKIYLFEHIQNLLKMVNASYEDMIRLSSNAITCCTQIFTLLYTLPLQFLCKFKQSSSFHACVQYSAKIQTQSNDVIERLLQLQFLTFDNQIKHEESGDNLMLTQLVYMCYRLCKNVHTLSTSIPGLLHCENSTNRNQSSSSLKLKRNYVFVKPWELEQPVHSKIVNNSLTYYVTEAANLRVEHLTTVIINTSVSDIKDRSSKRNGISHVNSFDNDVTVGRNGISLTKKPSLKSRRIHLSRQYKKILTKEQNHLTKLLEGISKMNSKVLQRNTEALYTTEPKHIHHSRHKIQLHWESNIGPVQHDQLHEIYMRRLWMGVKEQVTSMYMLLCISCNHNNNNISLNNYTFCKLVSDALNGCINKLDSAIFTSNQLLEVLSILAFGIRTLHNVQQWDKNLSKAIATLPKDRFRYVPTTETGTPASQTINLILCSLIPISDLINTLNKKETIEKQQIIFQMKDLQNHILNPLTTSLNFLNFCLLTKRDQFLLSATWEPFFVVISLDSQKIIGYSEFVIKTLKEIIEFVVTDDACYELQNLNDLLETWKSFNTSSLRMMVKVLEHRSRAIWKQHMQIGKVWKRRGSSIQVYQANPYVNIAVQSIFSPIIDNFSFLPRDESIEILCKCVIPFVRTWMEYILDQKILFSRFGSMQLDFDFLHFLKWFEQDSFDFSLEELSEIQSLPIITKMRNAILLLSCQPDRRKSHSDEYPPLNSGLNTALASSTSAISQVSAETINDAQFESIINDVDLREKERWLALRVKGGNSKRQFLCIG